MGILSAMEDAAGDEPETEEPVVEAPAAPEVEGKTEMVTLPKPPGRRKQARETENLIAKELKELRETVSGADRRYQEELSRRDQEIARLNGRYEALSQQRHEPAVPKVDSKELRKQAQAKLDAGDYSGWEELHRESVLVDAEARIAKLIPRQTAAPAAVPYAVQAVVQAFPDVMSHMDAKGEPLGFRLASIEDQRLAILGIPDGPERYKKAFEAVRASLPRKGAVRGSAATLSAVPPTRGSGTSDEGEGELGVDITPYMRQVAKKCGMTVEEYAAAYAAGNPKAVRRG